MRTLLILLMLSGACFAECRTYRLKPETVNYNGYAYFARYISNYGEMSFSFRDFPPTVFYWSPEYRTTCDVMTGRPNYH